MRTIKQLIIIMAILAFSPILTLAQNNLTDSQTKSIQSYLSSIANKKDGSVKLGNSYTANPGDEDAIDVTYDYMDENNVKQSATVTIKASKADKLVKAGNSAQVQSKVSSVISDANIVADTEKANEMMSGVTPMMNVIVGMVVWIVVILLPLSSALDIAYLSIPFFREKCEDAKSNSNGSSMMTKTTKSGETKLRWISDEAQYAAKFATYEEGKSPLSIYFGKRVWFYIILAIVLFILFTGNIDLVIQLALKIVSGLMSMLSGLAS